MTAPRRAQAAGGEVEDLEFSITTLGCLEYEDGTPLT